MNIQALYYFVAVAQDLNMTFTAKRLFMTQQALSAQIKRLEKQYGAVFFERKPRLKLTYQGEQMLAYARQVMELEQAFRNKLQVNGGKIQYKLSIRVFEEKGMIFMPYIVDNFKKMHPDVLLYIETGISSSIKENIANNRFDIYIGPYVHVSGDYMSENLIRDYVYFMLSDSLLRSVLGDNTAKFIEDHKYGISIEDASLFPVAMPKLDSPLRRALGLSYIRRGVIPNVVLESTSNEMMFDVCNTGYCASFVGRELLYKHLKENNFPKHIHYFPPLGIGELTYFGIAYRKGHQTNCAKDFIDCARDPVQKSL